MNVQSILRTIAFALVLFVTGMANAELKAPDFAYPKTVEKDATKRLNTALAANDTPAILRAFIDLTIAGTQISEKEYPKLLERAAEISARYRGTATGALMDLLRANMYQSIYHADRYVYDQRATVAGDLPADYNEWSGEQFRTRFTELADSALLPVKALKEASIKAYDSVIECSDLQRIYYPTLYDFVAYRVIDIYESSGNQPSTLPIRLVWDTPKILPMPVPGMSAPQQRVLNIYTSIIDSNTASEAPRMLALAERIKYIRQHLYPQLTTPELKAQEQRELLRIYRENSASEYSAPLLELLYNQWNNTDDSPISDIEMAQLLREYIQAHPSYHGIECIKDKLERLLVPSINVAVRETVAPGQPFDIKVTNNNCSDYTIYIYRIPDKNAVNLEYAFRNYSGPKTLLKTYHITSAKEMPFSSDTTITATLPEFGVYRIETKINSKPKPNWKLRGSNDFCTIRATRLQVGALCGISFQAWVVDALTGKPQPGAKIYNEITIRDYNSGNYDADLVGNTNENGFLLSNDDRTNIRNIYPTIGTDRFSPSVYVYDYSIGTRHNNTLWGTIYTDLPLYHQGDSVTWASISYVENPSGGEEPLTNRSMTAYLRDANYQPVDTIETITDDWGRATGKFVIPKDRLTGQYTIYLTPTVDDDFDSTPMVAASFTVSDYKLPTFDVTITSVARNTPTMGSFTVRGVVQSYSGVTLTGSKVKAEFSCMPTFYGSQKFPFYADSISTDASGKFSIVLPDSVISSYGINAFRYNVNITATSISGETHTASRTFSGGRTYTLGGNIPSDINAKAPKGINLTVIDAEEHAVVRPVCVTLTSDSVTQFTAEYPSNAVDIPWGDIGSGEYHLTIKPVGFDADSLTQDIVVYRPTDKRSPSGSILWVPTSNTIQERNRTFQLYYATSEPDTYVLYYMTVGDSVAERRWIKTNAGMHELKVTVPNGYETAQVILATTRDYDTKQETINLTVINPDNELVITTESFRDKLTPGESETWTFRTSADGKGRQSAIMLSMYNDAINALTSPMALNFKAYVYNANEWIYPTFAKLRYTSIVNTTYTPAYLSNCSFSAPEFNTYGMPLFSVPNIINASLCSPQPVIVRGYGATRKQSTGAVFDCITSLAVATDEEAAPDVAEEEAAAPEVAAPGTGVPDEPKEAEFQYRDAFTPLAFFRPMLTTDTNGILEFTFQVPNANARWYFQALALDSHLNSTRHVAQLVANKPVMVQPNMPRFLRHGDNAAIQSMVINNTDSASAVTVTTEIFNPMTGTVTSTASTVVSIAANSQLAVSTAVEAPLDASMLGFRIKVSNGRFTDGEQSMIPVLASVTPVIDTYPFYIPADSATFTTTIPQLPDSSRVTLQYCDNPTWYVVTALPGLVEDSYTSAQAAAAALFSASVSEGVLKAHPQIADALREWTEGDGSDSTLVSMLERNADLKTLLLQATPWLQDAQSDTERMQRLALLLDSKQIQSTVSHAISVLSDLHIDGEGWMWIRQYPESSEWATRVTLETLGRLKALGFLPGDAGLKKIINESLAWYEKSTERTYRRYPNGYYPDYVELCYLWPDFKQSVTGKKITARYIQYLVGKWRKLPLTQKPQAALMLKHYGYPRVARQVMESLMQFSESTPQAGIYWPSVNERSGNTMEQLSFAVQSMNALAAINGANARQTIDGIAQWLILQKETRNWGSTFVATDVIAGFLNATSSWLTDAAPAHITIGGESITASPSEQRIGYVKCDISAMDPSMNVLDITGMGNHPSWGSVVAQSIQPMLEVKASGCDALTIDKAIYVRQGGDLLPAVDAKVGDRLTVQLTLHVARDMEYVAITDDRSAGFEPVDQLPGRIWAEGLCFYRESLDSSTRIFIRHLPEGTYLLTYDVWANNQGSFTTGIASAQSQYAPEISAHSGGSLFIIR